MKNYVKIIAVFILVLFYVLTVPYISQSIINPVNKRCDIDDDCIIKDINCGRCDCGGEFNAVNKNWNKFCPLGERGPICFCESLDPLIKYTPKCIDNICKVKETMHCEALCSLDLDDIWNIYYYEKFNLTLEQAKIQCNC